jgi:hypothetical protein
MSEHMSKTKAKSSSPAPKSRARAKGKITAEPRAERREARPATTARPAPRADDADAFIRNPNGDGPPRVGDDLAEVLAEDFLESATRGNEVFEDEIDAPLSDEVGGPFVITDEDEELADDVDASNPPDAEPAPRPRAVAGLVQRPRLEDEGEGEREDEEEDDDDDDDDVEDDDDEDRLR